VTKKPLETNGLLAHYSAMPKSHLLGLAPWQIAVVMAVFVLTLIGALALAYIFRRWNDKVA
jgi:hypothetical protein